MYTCMNTSCVLPRGTCTSGVRFCAALSHKHASTSYTLSRVVMVASGVVFSSRDDETCSTSTGAACAMVVAVGVGCPLHTLMSPHYLVHDLTTLVHDPINLVHDLFFLVSDLFYIYFFFSL